MKSTNAPVATKRLFYSLVAAETGAGHAPSALLRIRVTYASGVVQNLPGRFSDDAAAEQFLERFYPDLVGKHREPPASHRKPLAPEVSTPGTKSRNSAPKKRVS